MKFALFCWLVAAAHGSIIPNDISANSKLGSKLLSRAIPSKRSLEQNDQADDEERDITFVAGYSLKYVGCSSILQVSPEGNNEREGAIYESNLVRFSLCPSGASCNSCSHSGEYLIGMREFVDAYTEAKMTEQEYKCEQIRENCYNDDENYCYEAEGANECIEYEGQEVFEIQEYLECREMENDNNNNANYNGGGDGYYGQYFIGPYCANDGKSINLGVFYNEQCTARAPTDVYASKNYGQALPYSKESIVGTECISCVDQEQNNGNNNNNNNNNYYNNYEVSQMCEELYEGAARCEENMLNVRVPDSSGCDFLHKQLPKLVKARNFITGRSGKAAKAFAWIFGVTTVISGSYAYYLVRQIKSGKVSLIEGSFM